MEIVCLGDSNVKKHQDLLHFGILSKCEFILTYNFDELKQKIFGLGKTDVIIIHVLTNDTKYICYDQSWKSDYEKKDDLIHLAHNFVNMIKQLVVQNTDVKIIISMLLPRFDKKDELNIHFKGNKIINVEISKHLLEVENVILVKNDDMEKTDFVDKYHLSEKSFEKLRNKWITAIGK